MTLPITGPFSVLQTTLAPDTGGYRPVWVYDIKTWYRQRRPHNLPLPYGHASHRVVIVSNASKEYYQTLAYLVRNDFSFLRDHAANKAYSRLVSKLKPDQAQLGAALGERKQSLEMIANRSLQLWKFVRDVKRFRFGDASRTLGLASIPKGVRAKGRAFGSNVLEYSFGWAPLVDDIGNAIQTLQKGVPPVAIAGRATERTSGSGTYPEGVNTHAYVLNVAYSVHYGMKIKVNNPNLFLANQLGLVNPASVAWELIPFSFVVDYFVNVSKFLESFTDFWGIDVIEPYTTWFVVTSSMERLYGPTIGPPDQAYNGDSRTTTRTPGPISGPTLKVNRPWVLSPKRALTSVALLLQQLR